jgi:TfoX/Sxy family transcriptional regulator of competence genes
MGEMGVWKKAPSELVKTFEEVIAAVPGAQPRRMFGYPAAFVNGQMFTGVFQDRLFVRLSESDRAELAKRGGKPFEPMPGRPMREYVEVPPALLRSRSALVGWVRRAFDYTSSLPGKRSAKAGAAAKARKTPASKNGPKAKTAGSDSGRKGRL